MIVYKCNGIRYSDGEKCTSVSENDEPSNWITIKASIQNKLHDARLIEGNGLYHFCSRSCLENFLFKNDRPPAIALGLLAALKNMIFIAKKYANDDPAEDHSTEHATELIKKIEEAYPDIKEPNTNE